MLFQLKEGQLKFLEDEVHLNIHHEIKNNI